MRRISLIPLELAEAAEAPAPVRDPASEDFTRLAGLISLIVDAAGCAARVAELRAATDGAAEATAELARARAEHEEHVRKATAELEARERKVRAREVEVFQAVGLQRAQERLLAEQRARLDLRDGRYRELPGGVIQDFGEAVDG